VKDTLLGKEMGIYVRVSDRYTSGVRDIASAHSVDGLKGSVFLKFSAPQSLSDRCQTGHSCVVCSLKEILQARVCAAVIEHQYGSARCINHRYLENANNEQLILLCLDYIQQKFS